MKKNYDGTHVRIPCGLLSTVTTAELTLSSSIFFVAIKTVSVGGTVTILENETSIKDAMQMILKTKYFSPRKVLPTLNSQGVP